ncbi:MAG: sulfurtransferase [Dehalococcoidia bacterium]
MSHTAGLGRRVRFGLVGALLSTVALVGVACSSDDEAEDTSEAEATTASSESAAAADERGFAEGHRLVTSAWLAEHLEDEGLVVVDLRAAEDYAAGHIAGAVNVIPGDAFSTTDANGVSGQIAPAEQVAGALAAAGITPEDTVVFYDGGNSLWAARSLWVLDVYGHANTRVLDGGWAVWSAESLATSTEAPTVEATEYAFSGEPNGDIIANLDELVAAINDPEKLVCDVRSAEEYTGRDVRSAQGGHVPGAVNEDWAQALDESSRFRSAEELRSIYQDTVLVSDDESTVYVYCQTGVRAAHAWFVLSELLGLEHVENYDGSWQEYGNRTDVEIERS